MHEPSWRVTEPFFAANAIEKRVLPVTSPMESPEAS
jgi:hypothetical protein